MFPRQPITPVPYWPSPLSGFGQPARVAVDRISYIEATVTRVTRGSRVTMSYNATGGMAADKRARFIKRFIDPMLKYDLGRKLLVEVNQGSYPVEIAWGNNAFGFNGTIALDRTAATNRTGSRAVIFIDEKAPDLKTLPTLIDNPDVLLFHELLHARCIQHGTVVNDEEEMERRVIGIGNYTKASPTENAYRDAKGLQRRCCWAKETL